MHTTFPVTHHVPFTGKTIRTDVKVESDNGVFMGDLRITAFSGEVVIHIHTSGGHFLNWCVVIVRSDNAIEVIKGPEHQRDSKIQHAIDAITEHMKKEWGEDFDTCWWAEAEGIISEWLNSPAN